MTISGLAEEAWRHYYDVSNLTVVVRPSIPILYFGDMVGYRQSQFKVLTVGLNSSGIEFPSEQRFMRFPKAALVAPNSPAPLLDSHYLPALNEYFHIAPYKSWFRCLEPVLSGMKASYYGHEDYVALHTDLFTPLATEPTWSRLDHATKTQLARDGVVLWHRLIDALNPDALVISIVRGHLNMIRWVNGGGWKPLVTLPATRTRTKPFTALVQQIRLPSGQESSVFYGQAGQQPFARLTNEEKRYVGERFRETLLSAVPNE